MLFMDIDTLGQTKSNPSKQNSSNLSSVYSVKQKGRIILNSFFSYFLIILFRFILKERIGDILELLRQLIIYFLAEAINETLDQGI